MAATRPPRRQLANAIRALSMDAVEAAFPRSDQPVVAIYTRDFDGVLERVKAGGLRVREFGTGMFLADDPSGNVVEVVRLAIQ